MKKKTMIQTILMIALVTSIPLWSTTMCVQEFKQISALEDVLAFYDAFWKKFADIIENKGGDSLIGSRGIDIDEGTEEPENVTTIIEPKTIEYPTEFKEIEGILGAFEKQLKINQTGRYLTAEVGFTMPDGTECCIAIKNFKIDQSQSRVSSKPNQQITNEFSTYYWDNVNFVASPGSGSYRVKYDHPNTIDPTTECYYLGQVNNDWWLPNDEYPVDAQYWHGHYNVSLMYEVRDNTALRWRIFGWSIGIVGAVIGVAGALTGGTAWIVCGFMLELLMIILEILGYSWSNWVTNVLMCETDDGFSWIRNIELHNESLGNWMFWKRITWEQSFGAERDNWVPFEFRYHETMRGSASSVEYRRL